MLDRRSAVFATAALLSAARVGFAQPAQRVRRIGFLSQDAPDTPAGQQIRRLFPEALGRLGYREGANLAIEWRWADGTPERLPELARGLVSANVELVVARTNAPIAAAIRASATLPVVMLNATLPVESGFVRTLARPGTNVTGTTYMSRETWGKTLQMLQEVAPRTRTVGWLEPARLRDQPLNVEARQYMERAASALGLKSRVVAFERSADIPKIVSSLAAEGIDGYLYGGGPEERARRSEIVASLRAQRIASVGLTPGFADDGGLVEYAPSLATFIERTASYVDRILRGARPADLPVEEPTTFTLVVNLQTAKAIGVGVPQSVLLRADRVIQ